MKNVFSSKSKDQRAPYETPAVVYEGLISTRAGSTVLGGAGTDAVDPADLFDN